ncbi:MAG: response regulator [Elusimicrobiota bacterium]
MKKHYTTTEISRLLGVTAATINSWINSGELKSFKTPGGHNRITQVYLLEFLYNNNIPVPSELDAGSMPKVLVVEDDEDVREFILAVIDDLEYVVEVEAAFNGYTAGSKIVKFKPDIVILDLMLPGVNGFEICRRIRDELGKETKVLAITGYYSEENRKKILEAGADAFIRKPVPLEDFKKILYRSILSFSSKYMLKKKDNEWVVNSNQL